MNYDFSFLGGTPTLKDEDLEKSIDDWKKNYTPQKKEEYKRYMKTAHVNPRPDLKDDVYIWKYLLAETKDTNETLYDALFTIRALGGTLKKDPLLKIDMKSPAFAEEEIDQIKKELLLPQIKDIKSLFQKVNKVGDRISKRLGKNLPVETLNACFREMKCKTRK